QRAFAAEAASWCAELSEVADGRDEDRVAERFYSRATEQSNVPQRYASRAEIADLDRAAVATIASNSAADGIGRSAHSANSHDAAREVREIRASRVCADSADHQPLVCHRPSALTRKRRIRRASNDYRHLVEGWRYWQAVRIPVALAAERHVHAVAGVVGEGVD